MFAPCDKALVTPPNLRARWTPTDDATLKRLAAEGKTFAEVADVMGRRESAIAIRADWLGIAKVKGAKR